MFFSSFAFGLLCLFAQGLHAEPVRNVKSPSSSSQKEPRGPGLRVDLGYEIYEGYYNQTSGLNNYLGIRYAADAGKYRWQAPRAPSQDRASVVKANAYPPRCPQALGAPGVTESVNFTGSEDCLFLSVQTPPNATNLPVLVWIHGGGYGLGQGNQDLSIIMNGNDNGFVGVAIQYRLGAFGFLSSDEVYRNGVVNAGILDQHFALEWVQKYISLFGGDPSRVTISGESAGGGSVMLQAMAYGGSEGTSLFQNIIAASPYLPMQYGYKDWIPSQSYYAFAQAAGCFPGRAYGSTSTTIFDCLVAADTNVLQNASFSVSVSGTYGTWAFVPVTDGTFIKDRPSRQLLSGKINGLRVLSGNNADEGVAFTIGNITTESDFEKWAHLELPLFNTSDFSELLKYYPSTSGHINSSYPRFATTGTSPPYALNVSSFATGQQQRAINLYAETTFVCPSYWLAIAFSLSSSTAGYKYQYSVPASQHGADLYGEGFQYPSPNISPQFDKAFMQIWGNFIRFNNPSISSNLANGNSSSAYNPASNWPQFSRSSPQMINLNETGGVEWLADVVSNAPSATEYEEPGLMNDITVHNAWTWEAGRGYRCDFWTEMGNKVPE